MSAPEPLQGPMPRIISVGVPACDVGRVLTAGEIGSGCEHGGAPGRWDHSYIHARYTLLARDDGRYLGLGFCEGQPVQRAQSSEFECR